MDEVEMTDAQLRKLIADGWQVVSHDVSGAEPWSVERFNELLDWAERQTFVFADEDDDGNEVLIATWTDEDGRHRCIITPEMCDELRALHAL